MDIRANKIYHSFVERFGSEPILVHSPARVNLIGEHTDYNDGYVLPAAIDKKIVLAIATNNLNRIRLYAADMDQPEYETELSELYVKSEMGWPNYILGVVDQLQKRGATVGGFDALFRGDIPIGAGLSSSAAIEGAFISGLATLFDIEITSMERAFLGQQVENQFVGVQCGIMDQFANLHGKEGHVIRLDCRSMEYTYYPFDNDDIIILLCDTGIHRELASSEYNKRREQCEKGVEILRQMAPDIQSLRDVSDDLLEKQKHHLDDVVYKRCRYVVDENRRVVDACNDLLIGDLQSFGEKMYGSHAGLRDLYEVSCPELDLLVDLTEELGEVLGARMMGGGFGGCTINLVSVKSIHQVINTIQTGYKEKLNLPIEFYIAKISEGVTIEKMER